VGEFKVQTYTPNLTIPNYYCTQSPPAWSCL